MLSRLKKADLFNPLLFLYFFTLHADHLGCNLAGYHLRANNLIALFLCVILLLRYRSCLFKLDRDLALAIAGITLSILISLLFSPYKERCLIFLGWYGWTLLCYFLLPYFLMQFTDSKRILTLYCASYIFVGSYALLQLLASLLGLNDAFAQQRIWSDLVRPNAFSYEPSFYALYMTPFIMMCNFHFLATPKEDFFFPKRLTVTKIAFINAIYLVSTSTSTVFAYAAFFLLIVFTKVNKKRVLKFMGSGLLCCTSLLALSPFLIKKFFFKFFYMGFLAHHSFYERWVGIKNAWNIFLENTLVGVGLGVAPSYLYDAWLVGNKNYTFDKLYDFSQGNPLKNFEPSNVFTELLASLGIVGCVAFVFFICITMRKACAVTRQTSLLSLNLLISLIVMLFVLQINQGLLRTYVWAHLAICTAFFEKASRACALGRLNRRKPELSKI